MKAHGRAPTFVSYAVALVLLAGCGMCDVLADYGDPVDLRRESVVGTWRSDPGRTFTFDDDGTFTATALPVEVFGSFVPADFDPAQTEIDGSGTWALASPIEGPENTKSQVRLNVCRLAGADGRSGGLGLDARRRGDSVERLYFFFSGGWVAYAK